MEMTQEEKNYRLKKACIEGRLDHAKYFLSIGADYKANNFIAVSLAKEYSRDVYEFLKTVDQGKSEPGR